MESITSKQTNMQQWVTFFVCVYIFELTLLVSAARGPIEEAIQSGAAADYNRQDCLWRRESDYNLCPDPQVHVYLYKLGLPKFRLSVDDPEWLKTDYYDENRENIFLIHGYNGGDDALPIAILRDAYLRNESYNVFVANWRGLGEPPCYPAAVANIRPAAKCLAEVLTSLEKQGLSMKTTTCVGHSLGAHVCGAISSFLNSKLRRIIGMDPAKPLIRPGNSNRLNRRDANFVEIIHTNIGYYGDVRQGEGHVNFCVNGGKSQPFCENAEKEALCSHNWSVCFMADSIDGQNDMFAEPCTGQCRAIRVMQANKSKAILMGHHTPVTSRGSFCLSTPDPPFCQKNNEHRGDQRCCV